MLIEGDILAFYKIISHLTEYSEIQQKMKPQSSWHIWTMTLANNYRFHFGGHFRKIAEDREREREREEEEVFYLHFLMHSNTSNCGQQTGKERTYFMP